MLAFRARDVRASCLVSIEKIDGHQPYLSGPQAEEERKANFFQKHEEHEKRRKIGQMR